jgi:hypothetical protein
MRELKRMQDEPGYVSAWEPKTALPNAPENTSAIRNIAVIGSRTFNDYPMLESAITNILKEKGVKLADVTIVSGGARGADSLGRDFAQKHGTKYLEFLPDWEKFGKRAGIVRNADIVKNSDFVLALWDGQSRGTRHSLELARQNGTPSYAYNFVTQKEASLEDQEGQPQETALMTGDHGQDTVLAAAQALKSDFGVEALNRVVFGSVPSSGADQTRGEETQFAEAGFSAHYTGGGSPRVYKKAPQKTADGGEFAIRVESRGNGAFTVFSQYEKNHIIDARRSHSAAADSAGEALAAVANFEKYLLPDTAGIVEQAVPMPRLRMR